MANNSNLVISISAKDQASGTFRKIKVSLGELERESSGVGESVGDLGRIFSSGLGKVAGGVAGFFAVGQLTQTVGELGRVGAAAERTRDSYEQMAAGAGVSGDAMLRAMRTATAGTVADSELMLSANRALMLGVADNADEMAQLMAAAIERGRSLGVSASQSVGDVITGIGRMSPEILDNVGITGAKAAFDDYAATLGTTADKLTEVQKKQALVNAVLSQSSGAAVANDAAAAFERMDASLQNAKEALGVLFSPAIAAIADQIANAATYATDALNAEGINATTTKLAEYKTQLQEILDTLAVLERNRETLATQPAFAPPELQSATPQDIDVLRQQAEDMARLVYQTQLQLGAMQGIGVQTANTLQEQLEYNRALWDGQAAWAAFQTEAQLAQAAVIGSMEQIKGAAQGQLAGIAQQLEAAQGNGAGVAWLEGANAQLERQIGLWAEAGYSIEEITKVLLPVYLDNLGKIVDRALDAYTAVAGIGKGAQQAANDATSAMRRIVAGLDVVTRRAGAAAGAIGRMGAIAGAVNVAQMGNRLGRGAEKYDPFKIEEPAQKSAEAVDVLTGAFDDFFGVTLGGGGGLADVSDGLEDLRSKVQGVIDSATVNDFGVNPGDFLPREDVINENARRLGAIVRDGIGNQEWLEEFRTEVPGVFEEIANSANPQQAAARILQEFQSGMRPELLDREMIKDRVRQMILGDQSSAALAQEIAQELSQELGISLAQAQEATGAALGVGGGPMLPGGGQAGPDGGVEGSAFVGKWTKTVVSMVTEFESSGATAGNAFGVGFMSVQSAYISQWAAALVSIVTAGVIANMAAQGSRTGAR